MGAVVGIGLAIGLFLARLATWLGRNEADEIQALIRQARDPDFKAAMAELDREFPGATP